MKMNHRNTRASGNPAFRRLAAIGVLALAIGGCSSGDAGPSSLGPAPAVPPPVGGNGDGSGGVVDVTEWIQRDIGPVNVLNDVSWDFGVRQFVAVGDGGTVLTSPDGIDWTPQYSGTDENLYDVACDGFDCLVAGDSGTILLTNNGRDWTMLYDGPDNMQLQAVMHGITRGFAAGKALDSQNACILRVTPGGLWTEVPSLPQSGRSITGIEMLPFGSLMLVATTQIEVLPNDGRVLVSADGQTWIEVVISNQTVSTLAISRADIELWAGGSGGRMYRTGDGLNWTEFRTPAQTTSIAGIAWSGEMLVAHGANEAFELLGDQFGVATTDDGETWQLFQIGSNYDTRGMAYGHDRFVSVGRTLPAPGAGAIYTTP